MVGRLFQYFEPSQSLFEFPMIQWISRGVSTLILKTDNEIFTTYFFPKVELNIIASTFGCGKQRIDAS